MFNVNQGLSFCTIYNVYCIQKAYSEANYLYRKQVKELGKFFSFSFLWGFFQWFFTAGDDCGFASFPTFGLEAYKNKYTNI